MGSHKEDKQKSIDESNSLFRKYLWGIQQNKAKMVRLTDITIENLKKVLEIKKGAIRNLKKGESVKEIAGKTKVSGEKVLGEKEKLYLENELQRLVNIKQELEALDNPWPIIEKSVRAEEEALIKGDRKILVIEDDLIILKMIKHFLSMEKYAVISADNAEDGLKKAHKHHPDLILLDIIMPGMNGYQFLSLLKKDEKLSSIPVIILSSLSRESDILEGLECGATEYMIKPFSPQVLLLKIKKILMAKNEQLTHIY